MHLGWICIGLFGLLRFFLWTFAPLVPGPWLAQRLELCTVAASSRWVLHSGSNEQKVMDSDWIQKFYVVLWCFMYICPICPYLWFGMIGLCCSGQRNGLGLGTSFFATRSSLAIMIYHIYIYIYKYIHTYICDILSLAKKGNEAKATGGPVFGWALWFSSTWVVAKVWTRTALWRSCWTRRWVAAEWGEDKDSRIGLDQRWRKKEEHGNT